GRRLDRPLIPQNARRSESIGGAFRGADAHPRPTNVRDAQDWRPQVSASTAASGARPRNGARSSVALPLLNEPASPEEGAMRAAMAIGLMMSAAVTHGAAAERPAAAAAITLRIHDY